MQTMTNLSLILLLSPLGLTAAINIEGVYSGELSRPAACLRPGSGSFSSSVHLVIEKAPWLNFTTDDGKAPFVPGEATVEGVFKVFKDDLQGIQKPFVDGHIVGRIIRQKHAEGTLALEAVILAPGEYATYRKYKEFKTNGGSQKVLFRISGSTLSTVKMSGSVELGGSKCERFSLGGEPSDELKRLAITDALGIKRPLLLNLDPPQNTAGKTTYQFSISRK